MKKMVVIAVVMTIAMLFVVGSSAFAEDAGQQLEAKYGRVTDSAYLPIWGIVKDVATAAKLKSWRFVILNTPELNAMALPDGRVYLTKGMADELYLKRPIGDDYAGLAFVMGHEIAHVVYRHSDQQEGIFVAKAVSDILVDIFVDNENAKNSWKTGTDLAGGLVFAKHSRADEYEADKGGFLFSTAAGFRAQGGVEAMTLLLNKYGRGDAGMPVIGWFASHPDTKNRLAALQKMAGGSEIGNRKSEVGNRESDIRNPKSEIRIASRPKGTIPNLRVAVIRSDVHGDAPSPYELNDRVRLAVEGNLQRAGIPVVGRGESLEATRREKNMDDADVRTQPNKKGVWVATTNLELDTFIEKKLTRLGVTISWSDYGIQVGDMVETKTKMNGKCVSIETGEIRPVVVVATNRRRIDQLTVYLPRGGGSGVHLDVQGQVEEMIRASVDQCADMFVSELLRVAGQIPTQDGADLAPVVVEQSSTSTTENRSASRYPNSQYQGSRDYEQPVAVPKPFEQVPVRVERLNGRTRIITGEETPNTPNPPNNPNISTLLPAGLQKATVNIPFAVWTRATGKVVAVIKNGKEKIFAADENQNWLSGDKVMGVSEQLAQVIAKSCK